MKTRLYVLFSDGTRRKPDTNRGSLWYRAQVAAVRIAGLSPLSHVALADGTTGRVLETSPWGTRIVALSEYNLRPTLRLVVEVDAPSEPAIALYANAPPVRWHRVGRSDCVTVTRALARTAGIVLPFTLTPGALARRLISQGHPHEWYPA